MADRGYSDKAREHARLALSIKRLLGKAAYDAFKRSGHYDKAALERARKRPTRFYHGTTTEGIAHARETGGFSPRDPEQLARSIEEEFGLPKDSVYKNIRFEFSRSRDKDPYLYVSPDEDTAKHYASAYSEMTHDALSAAFSVLNPRPDMKQGSPEAHDYNMKEHLFKKAWADKHGIEPIVVPITVPPDQLAETAEYQDYLATKPKEPVLTPAEYFDVPSTTVRLRTPVPLDQVDFLPSKEGLDALNYWKFWGDAEIGEYIREGKLPPEKTAAEMDKAIADLSSLATPLEADMTLYRAAKRGSDQNTNASFTSTTKDPKAIHGVFLRGSYYKYEIPKGTPVIDTDRYIPAHGMGEQEVILLPNTTFEKVGKEKSDFVVYKAYKGDPPHYAQVMTREEADALAAKPDQPNYAPTDDIIKPMNFTVLKPVDSKYTPKQLETLREYEDSELHQFLNGFLRNESKPIYDPAKNEEYAAKARTLDSMMNPSKSSSTLWRGVVDWDGKMASDLVPGRRFTDLGFVSTSRKRESVKEFMPEGLGLQDQPDAQPLTLKLKVPKGTPLIDLKNIPSRGPDSPGSLYGNDYTAQDELLLARSLEFEVLDRTDGPNGPVITLRVIPPNVAVPKADTKKVKPTSTPEQQKGLGVDARVVSANSKRPGVITSSRTLKDGRKAWLVKWDDGQGMGVMTPERLIVIQPVGGPTAKPETTGVGPIYDILSEEGIRADKAGVEKKIAKLATRRKAAQTLLNEEVDAPALGVPHFNPASLNHVNVYLEREGLPRITSVKDSELQKALPPKVARASTDLKKIKKEAQDLNILLRNIGPDGKVHPKWTEAQTGRWYTGDPPIQTLSASVREHLVPDEGNVFVTLDWQQQELRILAKATGDTNLQSIFDNGEDPHIGVYERIMGTKISSDPTEAKRQRDIGKMLNYALVYGLGPENMAERLGIGVDEAKELTEAHFRTFPDLANWMRRTKIENQKRGYAETLTGRKIPIDKDPRGRIDQDSRSARQAINYAMQGTAADQLADTLARIEVDDPNRLRQIRATIHDALLIEVPKNEARKQARWFQDQMEVPFLDVIPATDVKGPAKTWAGAEEALDTEE